MHIEPRSSRQLALALFALHGIALVVAINLTIPSWASIAISLVVLLNFYTTFNVHVLGRGRNAILSMVWDEDGDWKLIDGLQEKAQARLLPTSYIHDFLMVLNFTIESGGRRTAILLRDSLDARTYRQLLTRVRLEQNQ